jgi:hypothetical protein
VRTLSKKSIPKDYFNFLKHENNYIDNESKSRNRLKLLNNIKLTDVRVWLVILVSLLYRYGSKSKFTHSSSVNGCCLTPTE